MVEYNVMHDRKRTRRVSLVAPPSTPAASAAPRWLPPFRRLLR